MSRTESLDVVLMGRMFFLGIGFSFVLVVSNMARTCWVYRSETLLASAFGVRRNDLLHDTLQFRPHLSVEKPQDAVAVLHEQVLPFPVFLECLLAAVVLEPVEFDDEPAAWQVDIRSVAAARHKADHLATHSV